MTEAQRTAIRAGYVIAFDGKGHRLLRDGVVVIEGDSILHVGPRFDGRVDETVEAPDRVLTPGLISTHAHISGSPLDRSFIEDRGNPQFWYSGLFEMLPVRSEAQDEEAGPRLRRFLDGRAAARRRDDRDGDRHARRVRGRARAALRPARLHGPGLPLRDGGSRATASAWSGSGTRSRAGRASSAPSTSTSATTAPTAASCAASSRRRRSTPARPSCCATPSASPTRCKRPVPGAHLAVRGRVQRDGRAPRQDAHRVDEGAGRARAEHHPRPRHHHRRLVVDQLSGGRRPAHGRRRLLGGARGVGVRAARRRHGVVRALPRGGRQHVARHRHQSAERDRGDALGRGGLEDDGAQHGGDHGGPRLRRGHARRRAGAAARRPRAHRARAPRPTSCCGRRARGG